MNTGQSKSMELEKVKTTASALAYTTIKSDEPNARPVPLATWKGFSSHVSGTLFATVTYFLEGNKVRVHRVLDEKDHYYTLNEI
jgi:hypothetical protein